MTFQNKMIASHDEKKNTEKTIKYISEHNIYSISSLLTPLFKKAVYIKPQKSQNTTTWISTFFVLGVVSLWCGPQVTREKRDPRLQLASGGAAQLAEEVAQAEKPNGSEIPRKWGRFSPIFLNKGH